MTNKSRILSLVMSLIVLLIGVLAAGCVQTDPENPNEPTRTEWPEAGVYYFDAESDEYTLTLNAGGAFSLFMKGEHSSGSYDLTNGTLTFDFTAEGKENLTAALEEGVITLTYGEATMRFLKKVNCTVHFETNGGAEISDVTVVNGKTVAKPATDPVREGYLFVGWYADSEFKTPFAFGATPVTGDVTIYAQWSEALASGEEYQIVLDANYAGAEAVGTVPTVGGKLFDLPALSREGYDFKGWWISMENDGTKLSYRYEDGMILDGNTTLFALWQAKAQDGKLEAPVVNILASSITWNAIDGARSYSVKVIGPDGAALIDESTASTTFNVPFETYAAGQYEIRITANANSGESANSETVRFFTNKALSKVSSFQVVEPSTLVFNTVEHAEKYLITVVCGNPDHNHKSFDNGTSRTFNFANCTMTADGIKFVVTAVAEGYASSTSAEFVYKRDLAAVEGLRVDENTQTIYWNEVAGAAQYMVSVTCGNASHNHDFINNGSKTYISLKECAACEGGIIVKVYPVAKGYNSPKASEFSYTKKVLATPGDLRVNGNLLTWSVVPGAEKYEVKVGDKTFTATTNSFDLTPVVSGVEGVDYKISVRAVSVVSSLWSDELVARYYEMSELLSYTASTVTWAPVIGAGSYEIQVNDGAVITVADGSFSAKVELTRAGLNVIKVRFVDGSNRSEWATMSVFAHAVTFDTRGGSSVEVQYKAIGDIMELAAPTKEGYTFVSWYNVPGGPAANGMAYGDVLFSESGSIVLYAHYVSNEYDLTYNYGLSGSGSESSAKVSFEKDFTLSVPTATDPTVAFGGWYSAPYGMGVQYTDAKGNSVAPWSTLGGAEVYAFWIDYSLEFTLTKVNGKDAYAVMQGDRIALLSEITVPATYKGLPVAMVSGNAFKDCSSLTAINLPATIEVISPLDPFGGCVSLEAVNVYSVDGVAESRYASVDGVLIDNGLTSTSQAKLLFMPLAKTGTYRIPAGIVEIPEKAFANSALSKIVIPSSVTKIGKEAFSGCTKLTAVTFEVAEAGTTEQALTIGARAFSGCTMLEKITLPARLASISLEKYSIIDGEIYTENTNSAFDGCTALKAINVAANNTAYKSVDGALYSADGKTLYYVPSTIAGAFVVPEGTQQIAAGAFIGCTKMTEVVIPNTVTLVGECAFYGLNYSFNKVTFLGNGFNDVSVGKYAFRGCSELADVVFESGSRVSVLSEGAFYGCESLTSFVIPASMASVKSEAFRDCTELASVTFAANGKTLAFGEDVFYNCTSLVEINLPANVSEIPGIFSGCSSLQTVNVDKANPYFTTEDGVLFDKNKTMILFVPQGKSGEYTIPASVTVIANGVFRDNSNLTKLTIPASVTSIGDDAFRGSKIATIVFDGEAGAALTIGDRAFQSASVEALVLPASTKSIGEYAFYESSISSITLNEGLETVGAYAFYQTTALKSIAIPSTLQAISDYCFAESMLETITFAENAQVKSIGVAAFMGYDSWYGGSGKLKGIVIPASVEVIERNAFRDLTKLASVTFAEGSKLHTIGANAFRNCDYLEEITLPKSLTSVGAYVFADCGYLETVTFENGGEGDLVVGALSYYSYVNINAQNVTVIEIGNVFLNCNYLERVDFPSNLVEIGEYCFKYAGYYLYYDALQINFAENCRLATIGAYAFYYAAIESITIPASVRSLPPVVVAEINYSYDRPGIGAYAFYGNYDSLTTVTFEMGGTEPLAIGENAFANCDLLTEIVLPARLAPYTNANGEVCAPLMNGANVFNDANGLTKVEVEDGGKYYVDVDGVLFTADMTELVICPTKKAGTVTVPATVTKIHDRAFFECTNLEAVTFETGTAPLTIGDEAFKKCSALTSIVLPTNTVSLGTAVFEKCTALENLTLAKNLENFVGSMIAGCNALKSVNVESGSAFLSSDNGVLYNANQTTLIYYPASREDASYTVSSTVTSIAASAFEGNTKLQAVVLPAGLIEINSNAFASCSSLQIVNIPNTVELIGEWAFSNCKNLSELSFEMGGTGMMVVGKYAFQYIADTNLTLPATMAVVNNYVFYHAKTQYITFESGSRLYSLGDSVFMGSDLVSVAFPEGLTTIGGSVFNNCSSLKMVSFGEGLRSIGEECFVGSSVEKVSFPASLKTMGIDTFAECASLKEVTFAANAQLEVIPQGTFYGTGLESFVIPASVVMIEDKDTTTSYSHGAFQDCTALKSVTFAEGSKCVTIGIRAFYGCSALNMFNIPSSVSTINSEAFSECTALESIIIPATTTVLGDSIFYGCDSLATVVLNTKATVLPSYMFAYCYALANIQIPDSVTTIGSNCFAGTAIQSITLPKSVTDLSGYSIFYGCESLTDVTILGDVKVIGETMFRNCINLETIVLPSSVEEIGEDAFENCVKLTTFQIPASLHTLNPAFSGSGLAGYTVEAGNTTYAAVDGVLFSADLKEILSYPVNRTNGTFVVPKEVTFIGAGTFDGVTSLHYLIFEEGGTEPLKIGESAFEDFTSLELVEFPERLSEIGARAFAYCYGLSYVNVPKNMTASSFGKNAFYYCSSLIEVYNQSALEISAGSSSFGYVAENAEHVFTEASDRRISVDENGFVLYTDGERIALVGYVGNDTELTLPAGITEVGAMAFVYNSNVTKVVIPEGVTLIDMYAFYYAQSLVEVVLPSTVEKIGSQAFYECRALTTINLPEGLTSIGKEAFYYCKGLTQLILPSTVTTTGSYVFSGCYDLTILTTIPAQPSGFSSYWIGGASVIWGYDGLEHTYTFESNGGSAVESITSIGTITIPAAPTRDGYIFSGWYDNAEFEGSAISGSYYSSTKTSFYAKWMSQEEFEALYAGTSRDYAIDITLGEHYTVNVDKGGKHVWYKFTMPTDGKFHMYLYGGDTIIKVYDGSNNSSYADESKYATTQNGVYIIIDTNTSYSYDAGTTIYLEVYFYYSSDTGSLDLVVTA